MQPARCQSQRPPIRINVHVPYCPYLSIRASTVPASSLPLLGYTGQTSFLIALSCNYSPKLPGKTMRNLLYSVLLNQYQITTRGGGEVPMRQHHQHQGTIVHSVQIVRHIHDTPCFVRTPGCCNMPNQSPHWRGFDRRELDGRTQASLSSRSILKRWLLVTSNLVLTLQHRAEKPICTD